MQRIIYFLVVLVTLIGCHPEKIKDKKIDIKIDVAQSYKYDLTNGSFTVSFMDKPDTTIRFLLSPHENTQIVDKYYELGIDNVKGEDEVTGTILIEDNCMTMPKHSTILHVKSKSNSQDIEIDESCNDYSGDTKRGKSVSMFLGFIHTILKLKPEIKNAPMSDVIYK